MLPLGVRKLLFGTLGAVYPKADWAPRSLRAKTTLLALAADSAGGFFASARDESCMRARIRSRSRQRACGLSPVDYATL